MDFVHRRGCRNWRMLRALRPLYNAPLAADVRAGVVHALPSRADERDGGCIVVAAPPRADKTVSLVVGNSADFALSVVCRCGISVCVEQSRCDDFGSVDDTPLVGAGIVLVRSVAIPRKEFAGESCRFVADIGRYDIPLYRLAIGCFLPWRRAHL